VSAVGWSFYAIGSPAPQGSKRHVGGGRMVESSKAVKPWRDSVATAAYGAGPELDGPLAVSMIFTLARPKSAPKRDHTPYRTPDLSKLCRATEDAITTAGLWADDARVARYDDLAKVWNNARPGVYKALPVPGVIVAAVEMTEEPIVASAQLAALVELAFMRAWDDYGDTSWRPAK